MNQGWKPEGLALRLATLEDAAALSELYAPYVRSSAISFEYEPPSKAAFAARIAEINQTYPYLVCVDGTRIAGYAYAHSLFLREAYGWNAELSIYVDPACHGRGVGRTLYRALLTLLRLQGVQRAYAVIALPNEPSEAFHRAMGFTLRARFPNAGYKLGAWHDTVWYERVLGVHEIPVAPVTPFHMLERAVVRSVLNGEPCEAQNEPSAVIPD